MKRNFFLSPNTLNLFLDCPRCFWFHIIKGEDYRRPEQPTSTLPRKMDILIKDYFDIYREKNTLPPEIEKFISGRLIDEDLIKKWRNWQTGLRFIDSDGNQLFGALDECVVKDDIYIPVDYKSRGSLLKEDTSSYYFLQMSCYNFLLFKNNYKVSNEAYLVYYILKSLNSNGLATFDIEVEKIKTFPLDKVYEIFRNAIDILSLDRPPQQSNNCAFCNWAKKIINIDKEQFRLF